VSFLDFVLPFVLVLGVLISIHEFGHFVAAKLCGVKVEVFSLGFGRALLARTLGETEYRIAWLPLGGYVRMLGEIPGEPLPEGEEHRTFNGKPVWQQITIAAAGPAMNFVLPVFLLGAAYMIGVPTATSRVGTVLPDTPAAAAGVRSGDVVRAVDGVPVEWWNEFDERVEEAAPGPVTLGVRRGGEDLMLRLEVPEKGPDVGLLPTAPAPIVVVRGDATPAAQAGLRSGDRITRVGDVEIVDWFHLLEALNQSKGRVQVEALRSLEEGAPETVRVTVRSGGPAAASRLGLLPADLQIQGVEPESPAASAGLEPGDVILSANGGPVTSFRALATGIRASDGRPMKLGIFRAGEERVVEIVPEERDVVQHGIHERTYAIGVRGGASSSPEMGSRRVLNPFAAAALGFRWTVDITARTFEGIGMLVTGKVGREGLAGPIGIGVIAAQSFQAGWVQGILIMAVISVNLAILNLLPVPVLDGGQIVFALAQKLKGAPVSFRTREFAQQIGIAALLLLMAFAFWNDLARYWSDITGFFQPPP
jgi:regulator of sigma E protease